MVNNAKITEQARAMAREELGKDPDFIKKSKSEQFALYKHRVNELSQELSRKQELAEAMAAGDLIDDRRHLNRRIDQQGNIAGRTLRQVDFPQFVKDLLKGVFDANLEVTQEQMDSYADLVDRITQPASKFINTIDDATAYTFLAERQPDRFQLLGGNLGGDLLGGNNLGSLDGNNTGDSSSQITLGDANGNPVDTTSEDIRGEILQAKLQLVRQHQQLLEEMLLMGVTRLVVDNGKVKASVDFQIRAQEQIRKGDGAQQNQQNTRSRTTGFGGGFFGFGGRYSRTNTKTQISVSTAQVQSAAATTSSTQVRGEVEINFKTDYFPLENFRDILMNRDNPGSVKPKPDQTQNGTQP